VTQACPADGVPGAGGSGVAARAGGRPEASVSPQRRARYKGEAVAEPF
jgi:hypothetical protein